MFVVSSSPRTPLRLGGIVALSTLVLVLLNVVLFNDAPYELGRKLAIGIYVVPALVTFSLGWRLRNFRKALSASALVMLAASLAAVGVLSAHQGFWATLRTLIQYPDQLWWLARYTGIGLAAGVVGAGVRRLISGACDGR